eukprot:2294116-Rhodomonas_salina.2
MITSAVQGVWCYLTHELFDACLEGLCEGLEHVATFASLATAHQITSRDSQMENSRRPCTLFLRRSTPTGTNTAQKPPSSCNDENVSAGHQRVG